MAAKHQSKEKRQEQIIEAALECFFERGYAKTTIDDIAQRCSLSKGSVYWHFKSKDDILLKSIEVFAMTFDEEFKKAIEREDSSISKLRCGISNFINLQESNKGLFNLFLEFWAQSIDRDGVKHYWTDLLMAFKDEMTGIINEGIRSGEFIQVDVEHFVWALMATFDGLGAYDVLVDNLDIEKVINVYIDTLLTGLQKNKG